MKCLPTILLLGALILVSHAQTPAPAPASTPEAKPAADPFVKNAGEAASKPEAEGEPAVVDCVIVFEAYSLNKQDAAALFEAETGNVARYRRILDLTKAGKAKLQTLSGLATKSGQRAVTEAVDEIRYATEFQAPIPGRKLATPVAWETRSAGETLEFEPTVDAAATLCDLNLVPQRVTFQGFRDQAGMPEDSPAASPVFNSQKFATTTTTTLGEPHFLGTFNPPAMPAAGNELPASEVWLAFVTVSLQKTPRADSKRVSKDPVRCVTLEYSCYSLERSLAREILVAPPAVNVQWEKVQALAGDKKAQLEFLTLVKTLRGQRAVTEETQEMRYTSNYTAATPITTATSGTLTDANGEVSNLLTTQATSKHTLGFPEGFETRNIGIQIEVEPILRDDGNVEVNHSVQNTRYLGNLPATGVAAGYQPQPLFQMSKMSTSVTLATGKHMLIGTFNRPEGNGVDDRSEPGRTRLLFVRATIGEP